MKNMTKEKKLLYIARGLLFVAAVGILFASFFFFSPKNNPLGISLSPQISQTLLYGGIVLFIALFAWRWPVPGGIIAVLFGSYKLLEYIRFFDSPFTLVPAIAYFILYGLFIAGGVLIMRVGLRRKTLQPPESGVDNRIRRAARIATVAAVIVAIIYSFVLGVVLVLGILSYVPGFLLGGMIFISPLLLAIAYIAWRWPAPGGLLTLVTGIPILIGFLSSNWGMAYVIPYALFSIVFILGGTLNLAVSFPVRKKKTEGEK